MDLNFFDPDNTFPHLAYLELSAYFIRWYKSPPGSPAPVVLEETLFYFYDLQGINNTCVNDPLGPGVVNQDALFPSENALYATVLLRAAATLVMSSGASSEVRMAVSASCLGFFANLPQYVYDIAGSRQPPLNGASKISLESFEDIPTTAKSRCSCSRCYWMPLFRSCRQRSKYRLDFTRSRSHGGLGRSNSP